MRGRAALALPLAALFGTAAPALADAPPPGAVRLTYTRAPGAERCASEQAFRDAMGAQVARDLFATDAPAELAVTIVKQPHGYQGTLTLREPGSPPWTRALPTVASCAALVEDLAFAASVKLDPAGAPQRPRSGRLFGSDADNLLVPPPSSPSSPLPADPVRADTAPIPTARPASASTAFRLGLTTWIDLATAPRPAFGLSLDAGLRVAWFSIAAEARWDPPAASDVGGGVALTTTRIAGALVPCGHVAWFFACALGELGQMRGTLAAARVAEETQATFYAAAGGRLGAEIGVAPHLAVRPAVDLLATLHRTAFRLDERARWETPAFAGGVGVGLVATF